MYKYKMVACDLDGTLLGWDCSVSRENKEAIKKLCEKGVLFVPCSGRTLSEMKEVSEIPEIRYIIYSSGAAICDKKTNQHFVNGFDKKTKEEMLKVFKDFEIYWFLHADGECYVDKNLRGKEKEFNLSKAADILANTVAKGLCGLENNFMEKEVEMISIFFKSEKEQRCCWEKLLHNDKISVVDTWPLNLEIFSKTSGKDKAIIKLCQKIGLDTSEVISIGDSSNDIEALKAAGLGIAVSNGNDDVKKIADEIACSNDEHIAQYVLEHYF